MRLDIDFLVKCVEYYARNHPEARAEAKRQLEALEETREASKIFREELEKQIQKRVRG